LVGDIFFAYDSDIYQPNFSQVVMACTKTRLYDGLNLADEELLSLEKVIMHAPEHEKDCIKKLYSAVTNNNDPVFWYDLCYGLVEFGSGDLVEANVGFSKVKKKVKGAAFYQFPPDAPTFFYDHWRIDAYLQECSQVRQKLSKYKSYLEEGTYQGEDLSCFNQVPKSRYDTFLAAFEHFEKTNGRIVVELGTTSSFVHSGLAGYNSNDTKYWTPGNPENWNWSSGGFTRMAAECLGHLNPVIYTIDLARSHIERCKVITSDFKNIMQYYICSSVDFLQNCPFKIDLLYLDTGDMNQFETAAQLQYAEATIIVERDLIAENGIILIDDVRNQTPKKFGEKSDFGKSKYSIPYLLNHGYELVADEYQAILKKRSNKLREQ
jgi:hypothetical protein